MMRPGKPHLYKIGKNWYCKCVVGSGYYILGPSRKDPESAYVAFKEIACFRGGVVFRDAYPFDPYRF